MGTSVKLSSEKSKWEEEHCLEAGKKKGGGERIGISLKSQNFQGKTCRVVSHGCDVSHVRESQCGVILESVYEV